MAGSAVSCLTLVSFAFHLSSAWPRFHCISLW